MTRGVCVIHFHLSLSLGSSTTTAGNYTGTLVRDNFIYGGFASDIQDESDESKGQNKEDAIIKSVTEVRVLLFAY